MTERIKKGMVKRAFAIFTKEAKIPTSSKWLKTKRQYSRKWLKLDYNPSYGGWRMDWIHPKSTESFFTGMTRRNTKEMYNYLWGFIERGRMKKGGRYK